MLDKLNAQSTPVKAVITIVLAAIIVGGAWYGYTSSIEDQNKKDAVVLDAKKKENADLRSFETKVSELERQIASLKQQMELQKRIVPDEKEADKFIIMLQETAANSGINLRRLSAKSMVNKEYYSEVPFDMEIDGPYYGVMQFFDKLSGQTRIVNVEALSMKGLSKGSKYPVAPTDSVSVNAVAKTFFSRDAASAAPAPTPVKK
jgi:type IV pilus assembly protein PilO